MDPKKSVRAQRLETFGHHVTAFVIILKGADKAEIPGKFWIGLLFILLGIFIVLGTTLHHKWQRWLKHLKAYIMVIEAVVLAIVGYMYMNDGAKYLQYVCWAASLIFIVAIIVYLRKVPKHQASH
jgi:hypothetical protein